MKLGKLIKTRKYLLQIYFAITLAAILVVTIAIWSIFFAIKDSVLSFERQTSIEMLTQIKNNTKFIQQTNKDICFSIFKNNDVQSLLYQSDPTEYELMTYINRLSDSYLSANPSIHSIYIYNSVKKQYYSTNNGIYNIDEDFMKRIEQKSFMKNFTPVVRNSGSETVATFRMNESYNDNDYSGSAIYVNMRFDQMINYMDTVNRIGEVESGSLYIFDENDICINSYVNQNSDEASRAISQRFDSLDFGKPAELFDVEIANLKYAATLLNIDDYDWKLVRIYPYDTLFAGVNQVRLFMFLFNIIADLVIMSSFALLAKRIYRPVNRLMENMGPSLISDGGSAEFERLEQSFRFSKAELSQLEKEKELQGVLVREYALKNLFLSEHKLTREELDRLGKEQQLLLDFDSPMCLILLRIGDFSCLNSDYDKDSDKALVLFGIMNVLNEIFSEIRPCECVMVNESCIAVLCGFKEDDKLFAEPLNKAQKVIYQLFSISFCACVTEAFEAVKLPVIYEAASNGLNDRFMLGEACIITEEVRKRQTGKIFVDYTFEEENAFIACLIEMKTEAAQKALDKLTAKIKTLDFQSASIAAAHLTSSIQQAIFEINKHRKEPITAKDYSKSWEQTPNITLEQYQLYINSFLETLQSSYIHGSSKHQILAETIKDYIDKMYDSYDLSAATVADMLKISPSHAGRVFNTHMDMSIPEYINLVRLKKAMEWMQNSDFTIQEIMSKVGYQNESYFYKVFKERFGMSPRSYIKSLHEKGR